MIADYFQNQLEEIRESKSLRLYGSALAATHLLTLFAWWKSFPDAVTDKLYAICWPIAADCWKWRLDTAWPAYTALAVYGVLALLAGALFTYSLVRENAETLAYPLLAVVTLMKLAFMLVDYRFTGDEHLISFALSFAFLFINGKKQVLPVLICLFYFTSGAQKLNTEWLGGTSLVKVPSVAPHFLKPLLVYVPFTQVLLVWALLLDSGWIFWLAFANFVVVDFFSWSIVGYLFSGTMGLLVAWFPISALFDDDQFEDPLLQRLFTAGASPATYVVAAIFIIAQAVPWIRGKDSELNGEGRIFAVGVPENKTLCQSFLFIQKTTSLEEIDTPNPALLDHTHCDPLVFFNEAKSVCRETKDEPHVKSVSVYLRSRRTSDQGDRRIIELSDFCKADPSYSVLPVNHWILSERPIQRGLDNGNPIGWTQAVPQQLVDEEALPVTSQYRGGETHTAFTQGDVNTVLNSHEVWRALNANFGIHDASKSSPAVDDSGVYVGGDSSWFYAYNPNGKLRWKFYISNAHRGIHSTAALDEKYVYVTGYNGRVYKLDKVSGELIWALALGDAIGASPTLYGDSIYIATETSIPDGLLARVRRSDGAVLWTSQVLGEQSHSTPTIDAKDKLVFNGNNSFYFRAFDLETGELRWEFRAAGEIKSTSAYYDGVVFFSSWDGFLYALGAADGKERWRYRLDGPSQSSPTIWPKANGILLTDKTGAIHLVDIKTGQRIAKSSEENKALIGSGLVISDSAATIAIIACRHDALCLIDPTGKVTRKIPLKGSLTGTPAFWKNRFYYSEDAPGNLAAFGTD